MKHHFAAVMIAECGRIAGIPAERIHNNPATFLALGHAQRCVRCTSAAMAVLQLLRGVSDAGWRVLTGAPATMADSLVKLGYLAEHHKNASGQAYAITDKGAAMLKTTEVR